MSTEPQPFDPTDELRTREAIDAFIRASAETGDIVYQVECEQIAKRARKRWKLEWWRVRKPHA